ncbi:MAG: hypothetical protein GYA17_05355 [Chloroflexi bacterium]|nr:hypothetical protein [Anaerolineaceae bacterium]NMB87763.1 hypothetical protein [Chloroflexota bacterium]
MMPPVELYNSSFATLWYHPDKKIVHHQIHKFIYGEEFHRMLLTGTEAIQKNHAHKWLSNDRSNAVLRKEDIEWGMVNWLPQTVQAGWKYWAIVQPEKMIAQMNMESLVEEYAKVGIVAHFFTDEALAMQWLESQ